VRITTPKEVAFVQAEISLREEELSTLEGRLIADKKRLEAQEMTVKALIIKIDYDKRRLVAQERYLTELLDLKQQLDTVEVALEAVEPLPDQVAHHKQEIAVLGPKIQAMIQELHAKRLVYNVSKTYLETLESHKKCLLDMLRGLKMAFSPSRVVPAEVLATIFSLST
jgi:chromosome segregation ATPase